MNYKDYAKIPMQENDAGAKTIGEYLEKLLLTLWDEQDEFSGKRPFGNSGWDYEICSALISAGVVSGKIDENGYVDDVDYSAADDVVRDIIRSVFNLDIKKADNEDSKKNIDFDMFDFSRLSIDEKFWALVFFIFANCKDIEFIEKIKDKFNIDNEKLRQEMNM